MLAIKVLVSLFHISPPNYRLHTLKGINLTHRNVVLLIHPSSHGPYQSVKAFYPGTHLYYIGQLRRSPMVMSEYAAAFAVDEKSATDMTACSWDLYVLLF